MAGGLERVATEAAARRSEERKVGKGVVALSKSSASVRLHPSALSKTFTSDVRRELQVVLHILVS